MKNTDTVYARITNPKTGLSKDLDISNYVKSEVKKLLNFYRYEVNYNIYIYRIVR